MIFLNDDLSRAVRPRMVSPYPLMICAMVAVTVWLILSGLCCKWIAFVVWYMRCIWFSMSSLWRRLIYIMATRMIWLLGFFCTPWIIRLVLSLMTAKSSISLICGLRRIRSWCKRNEAWTQRLCSCGRLGFSCFVILRRNLHASQHRVWRSWRHEGGET